MNSASSSTPLVSLIVATYNEALNVPTLVDSAHAALNAFPHEIIIVDDDSPDRTWEVVERLQSDRPWLRLKKRIGPRGLSSAVLEGFREATGSILGVMDGDLSHDERILPLLVEAIQKGAEISVGSRRIPGGGATNWPVLRRLMSSFATELTQRALHVELFDPMSGFFFVSRDFYARCVDRLEARGYKILLEMYCKGHPRYVKEIPYVFRDRRQGQSKISLSVLRDFVSMLRSERREALREPAPCPLCGRVRQPSMIKSFHPIYKCPGCRLLYVGTRAMNLPPQEVYGADYYAWIRRDQASARQIKLATFRPWLQRLRRWTKPGHLLEVGSAYGHFLEEAVAQGWKVWGVEISDHARDFSNAAGTAQVAPTLEDLPANAAPFQAIALCDVIEHFYDPRVVLPKLRSLLAPEGVLLLSTPDVSSLFARAMGRAWFHIKPLEHPILFTRPALQKLLQDHGFTVLEMRRAYKRMTLSYAAAQARIYKFPLHGVVPRIIAALPESVQAMGFPVYSGEMLVFAKRKPD